jgi:hypothetical protein
MGKTPLQSNMHHLRAVPTTQISFFTYPDIDGA